MPYGVLALAHIAPGARLAHAVRAESLALRKGHSLTPQDLHRAADAGLESLTVITLDPGHIWEEEAADRLATLLVPTGQPLRLKTAPGGRVNLIAATDGLLRVDAPSIHRLNSIAESLTLATLPDATPVTAGQILATLKVIPFQVAQSLVAAAETLIRAQPPLRLAPWRTALRVVLIQTTLPQTSSKVLTKTREVVEARLQAMGVSLAQEERSDHTAPALAAVMAALPDHDLCLVVGASAIADRADVIPAALTASGGTIQHFGMPVDPGNLLLIGHRQGVPVVGLPGCARSPARNGFDWVLERLAAGEPVTPDTLQAMGVGGLLKDTPARGITRVEATTRADPRIVPVILAAGQGTRMGGTNKLLLPWRESRSVVEAVAHLALGCAPDGLVVLGHEAVAVAAALTGFPTLRTVINPAYATGQATSLRAALAALPEDADGALVMLGDMPLVRPQTLSALVDAFDPLAGSALIHPLHQRQRGNPVVIGRRFFAEVQALEGDMGARSLFQRYPAQVRAVEVEDPGTLLDLDTPEAYEAALATQR